MAGNLVKSVMLKIVASDADAEAKLAAISAKADELAAKHPELTPKINSAAATAKLGVLRNELRGVAAEADKTARETAKAGDSAGQGFMSRFGSWLKPSKFQLITAGVMSGLAALPALTAGVGAMAGIAFGAKLLIGSKQSQGPLYSTWTGFMGKLTSTFRAAAGPLIAPLKQAFASLGGFLHSIAPMLRQIFAALAPAVMPLTHGLEALVRGILPGFLALMKAAAPAVKVLASLIAGLGKDLGGMFAAMAPAVKASSAVFGAIGKVLGAILPIVGHLAAAMARSLGPVLVSIGKALSSLAPVAGVVARVLGSLAGAVLSSLAGALQAVARFAGALAPSFTVLAGVLGKVFNLLENSGVFGVLENALEQLAVPLASLINALVKGLAPILGQLIGVIGTISGAIVRVLVGALVQLMPAALQLVQALTKLLVSVLAPLLPAILQLAGALIKVIVALLPILTPVDQLITLLVKLITIGLTPVIGVVVKVVGVLAAVVTAIATVIGWVVKIIAAGLEWLTNFRQVGNGIGVVINAVVGFFKGLWQAGVSNLNNLISFVTGIPRRIMSALGNLGTLLWNAGRSIVQGLINGITSMIGSVGSAIGSIASTIRSYLPFSPAKRGPLSGSGSPHIAGAKIGQMLAAGISGSTGAVAAAAGQLAGAATVGAAGGGRAGGGAQVVLQVQPGGSGLDHLFMTWLQEQIRTGGGDPSMLNRKVAFA